MSIIQKSFERKGYAMDKNIDVDSFIVWLLTQLDTDSEDSEREARVYERVFSRPKEIEKDEQE
jgi:hypothetical protein